MHLITCARGHTTGINLAHNAFWRLALSSSVDRENNVFFSLVVIYPPSAGQTIKQSQIVLARSHVPMATNVSEVDQICQVALDMGSFDADVARMGEAFNLFKNHPRTRSEVLEQTIKDATEIMSLYWRLREWLSNGASTEINMDVQGYHLIAKP